MTSATERCLGWKLQQVQACILNIKVESSRVIFLCQFTHIVIEEKAPRPGELFHTILYRAFHTLQYFIRSLEQKQRENAHW